MKEEKDFSFKPYIIFAIIMFIIVISTYTINFYENTISKIPGDWGTFGDFMGGTLNPILAFLSFLALLQTIKIQGKELKKSSEALELSKDELSKSSKALEEQSASLKIQNFENTFFNMISLHNEIVNNITIDVKYDFYYTTTKCNYVSISYGKLEHIHTKRKAIDEICSMFTHFIIVKNPFRKLPKAYDLCHEVFQDVLGHYFGNIYQILKFISTSENIDNKRKYSDLFRAQFSSDELQLLFYHCTGSIGSRSFKKYIEEFEFFEHLVIKNNDAFRFIFNTSIYNNKAFGKNQRIINYILLEKQNFEENIKFLENKENLESLGMLQLCKYYFYKKEYDLAINTINKVTNEIKKEIKERENNLDNNHYYIKSTDIENKKEDLVKTYLLQSDIYFEKGDAGKGERILSEL